MLNFGNAWRVTRKEIREATRDRNLLLNLVIMPLFLYPLVGFGAFQIMQIVQGVSEQTATVVAIDESTPASIGDSLRVLPNYEIVEVATNLVADDAESFRQWRLDAETSGALIPDTWLLWFSEGNSDQARIVFDSSRDRSRDAKGHVEDALDFYSRQRSLEALASVGLSEADMDLWALEDDDTASATERGQELLSAVLPIILLLMLTMGTFASVLDTVVGERERGTLETMLVSPLKRGEVLLGKYFFVIIASLVAFTLNLGSMSIFMGFVLKLLDIGENVHIGVDIVTFGVVFVAAALTAAFLAALLMILAIPSRTYREGQAALNPFYLLTMVPGLIVVSSREALGMKHALIPVLNATALFKSALRGEYPLVPILVTYGVLALVTGAVLFVATRLVAREDIFLEPNISIRELLTGRSGGRS